MLGQLGKMVQERLKQASILGLSSKRAGSKAQAESRKMAPLRTGLRPRQDPSSQQAGAKGPQKRDFLDRKALRDWLICGGCPVPSTVEKGPSSEGVSVGTTATQACTGLARTGLNMRRLRSAGRNKSDSCGNVTQKRPVQASFIALSGKRGSKSQRKRRQMAPPHTASQTQALSKIHTHGISTNGSGSLSMATWTRLAVSRFRLCRFAKSIKEHQCPPGHVALPMCQVNTLSGIWNLWNSVGLLAHCAGMGKMYPKLTAKMARSSAPARSARVSERSGFQWAGLRSTWELHTEGRTQVWLRTSKGKPSQSP